MGHSGGHSVKLPEWYQLSQPGGRLRGVQPLATMTADFLAPSPQNPKRSNTLKPHSWVTMKKTHLVSCHWAKSFALTCICAPWSEDYDLPGLSFPGGSTLLLCLHQFYNFISSWTWWHHDKETLICITDPLWGESINHCWIPLTMQSFDLLLLLLAIGCWRNIWVASDLVCHDTHVTSL